MSFVRRHPIATGIAALVLLLLVLASFPIVPETKQAVVVRFGKPVAVLNQYQANRPIGAAGAGISFRVPFVD
ncbi:MAG TPA: protease modulator HflC, partial [Sphingomicrobium sp.]|nr:protease modulator HflC [Sphingomicrobium sp.]